MRIAEWPLQHLSFGQDQDAHRDAPSRTKAALNMLMKGYAAKNAGDRHMLLLVVPGWVRTDMGGSEASLSIEESIPLVVDIIGANRETPGLW